MIGFQEHLLTVIYEWTTNMFIFFHIRYTWLGVSGSTSSDFLEFNKTGFNTNTLSMAGYQTCVGQNGTTIISSAISCFKFGTLDMTEIWEECIKL